MSEVWRGAGRRTSEFDAVALAYDRYRPRYPAALFDDLSTVCGLEPGDRVIEIGAGTGIATLPLIECGFQVTAIEPASAMAAVLNAKVGDRAVVVVGRFEDTEVEERVDLLAAFNSWHWVNPTRGVERSLQLLGPEGVVAVVWTEVISWGEEPFAERLAQLSGSPWGLSSDIAGSRYAIEADARFIPLGQRKYRFDRRLDARTFVEVTRTYGAHLRDDLLSRIEAVITNEFGGHVTKVEEAVLYAYGRARE